jgi:hypothetical protein
MSDDYVSPEEARAKLAELDRLRAELTRLRLDAMLAKLEAASQARDAAVVRTRMRAFVKGSGGLDGIDWETWGAL